MRPTTVSNYQNVLTTGPTNPGGAGGNQAIRFEETGQSLIAILGNDTANNSSGYSGYTLTSSLTPGAWVNVALTWDSSANQVAGYLNGVQVFASSNSTWPSMFNNMTFGLGFSSSPSDSRYYDGLMNDVRFYNVVRSQANIQSDMGQLLTGSETGLVGYWPLNDGSGVTAADLTASHHNGTLGGGTAADEPTWVATGVALGVPGNFTQTPGGTLDVQLGGTPASGDFGQLDVSGTANFAGLLRSQFVGGYTPTAGDNFTVANYASSSGGFGAVDLAETSTVAYSANVNATNLVLASQAATLTPTQTTVTSSAPGGANYGQLVQYTATVTATSGTPTGSVQFQIDGLNYGTPETLAGSQATLTVALPAGTHSIAAFYVSNTTQFANSDDSASPLTETVNPATVTASSIELYYTTYGGPSSVDKVAVTLNQSTLTLGTPVPIVQNLPADGLIFLPNGDLLTANGSASEVNPTTGAVTTDNQVSGEHLALDPSGKYVWTSPQPGPLFKLPINPLGPATQETLKGDDTQVTHLAFDNAGQAFYVTSGPGGFGSFGLIDLKTFTTQRIYSNLPSAHGISYDPFTGDLFLVGSDSVTQIDPNTLKIISELDFPGTGFQFDQGAEDGKGHLYAADNGGHLLVVDYSATGLIGDPHNFVASPFLQSALDDVAPLAGLGGTGIPVTINHQLPPTGYNVNPTSITPDPASFSSTAVTWNATFTPGQPETDKFQLTGQVTNMAPGEVRQISEGTTVTATVTAQNGTQIPVTINLPPVIVAAQHIIELAPPTETVDQGATATYTVELSNPLPTAETYTLSLNGLPAGESVTLASSVPVPAGQTVDVPLSIKVPVGTLPGTQAFLVSAQTLEGALDSVEGQLTVTSTVAIPSLAVHLSLSPPQAVAGQTNPAVYTLTVTNTGDTADTYSLAGAFPAGFTGAFSQTTLTVPPGLSNFRDVQLTLTPPAGATAQNYPFTVTATSTTDGTVSSQASGTVAVQSQGVQVALTPTSAVPGSTFQLTVTNTGQAADTFNLSLGGPAAMVSTLGTNQVTLQPGASQTVPVTTKPVNFADPGTLPLTGVAVSQTNSAVQGQSTANLTIAARQNMTAQFNPTQQTLVVPGTTSFLLEVNNTGNTVDSYSATILGTTGPVTANLVGLDGQPTQRVPIFKLPGLASGDLLLQVNDTGTGQGTVTVLVQSLTNSGIQAAPTATVIVPVPTTPTPTLTLTNNTGLAVAEGSSTPLTSATLEATDSDSSVKAAGIVYTLTAATTQGNLLLNGQPLAKGETFTQDDINNGRVVYQATEEGGDSFGFSVAAKGAATTGGAVLIAISDPSVVATGGFTLTAVEGTNSAVQTVATFTDPGGFEPQAGYTAEVNWRDGTSSVGAIILPGAGQTMATVTAQHAYAEEGQYSIQVTLHHEGAADATATSSAVVSDPAVVATGDFTYLATADSAGTSQTVVLFTDPGGAEVLGDYTATINWGDGGTVTNGAITVDPNTHVFTVSGQHSYAQSGSYSVQVTLSHDVAPAVTATSSATISPPVLTLAANTLAAVAEGSSTVLTSALLQTTDSDSSVTAANIIYTLTSVPTQGTLLLGGQALAKGGTFTQADINNGRLAYQATEEGGDSFGFNIAAAGAVTISGTFSISISDPSVVAAGGYTLTAVEESNSGLQTVATFTDPGGFEPQAGYTAQIAWGDGTSSTGAILLPAAGQTTATVTGQHVYAEEGQYAIQVTLHHEGAPDATATSSAAVSDPSVAASGGFTYLATAGSAATAQTVALFTDPGAAEKLADYSATVNWGDGSTATGGIITTDPNTHVFSVSGQHNYAQAGTYSVAVTLTHDSAPAVAVTSSAVISAPQAQPMLTVVANTPAADTEGLSVTITSALLDTTDANGSVTAANIVYTLTSAPALGGLSLAGQQLAKGSTFTQADINNGRLAYRATEEEADSFGFSVSAPGATSIGGTFLINTSDPAVPATGGFTLAATEGIALGTQTVATFTDPGGAESLADYAATIDWGDGTSATGGTTFYTAQTQTFTVSGQHTYADEGTFPIRVTLHHDSASDVTVSGTAQVGDAKLSGSTTTSAAGTEGATSALSGATFTDADPGNHVADMAATITWGDGSSASAGSISYNSTSGAYTVSGSHTYAEEGTWPLSIVVSDDGGQTLTLTGNATVADAALSVGQPVTIQATAGQTAGPTTLATFSDLGGPETVGDYSATINWGDNSTSAATVVSNPGGVFNVQGSHLYATQGSYAISISIVHEHGVTASASATAVVAGGGKLIVLDPEEDGSLEVSGGGQVQLTGGGTITVDSKSSEAIVASGQAVVSATEIDVAGSPGYNIDGQASISGKIVPRSAPVGDPYAGLSVQPPKATYGSVNDEGGAPLTLQPGTYMGGIEVSGKGQVTLSPGVYYIAGGGITVSGNGSLTGQGVFIYNSDAGRDPEGVTVTGQGVVSLTAPTSGAYQGIALVQAASNEESFTFSGSAQLNVTGAVDASGTTMNVSGMAKADFHSNNAAGASGQVIVNQLEVSGQAQFAIDAGLQLQQSGPLHAGTQDSLPPTPNDLYVMAVYQDLLGRPVDAPALAYWSAQLGQGLSRSAFVNQIDRSAEYFANLVKPLYQTDLGRAADSAGLAWWVAQLQAGLSDAQLQADFLGSAEFYQKSGGTDPDWVNALYQAVLHRPADAQGDAYWAAQLAHGEQRTNVAYGFTFSPERANQQLADDYAQYLGRAIDPQALASGEAALAHGATNEDTLTMILASDEYYKLYGG
jgi:uncharacterized membrane protein